MRLIPLLFAVAALSACSTGRMPLPQPQTIPAVASSGQWYKLEQSDSDGNVLQTHMLAVEPFSDGLRFVQTDALGAPVSRQTLTAKGWKNDGFVAPNAQSRRLFAALLPLVAAGNPAGIYPQSQVRPSENHAFCTGGEGALFRYRNQDLWCTAQRQSGFVITFPDRTRWTVSPIQE
ncbi:hypothetical protein [Neisseria sp. CCUG12390]|uniref:hypothetical protein n=1 Tax=Neisseria sp. CCUG12390 TaxID=3392035 RepID=UPI003A0FECC7